MSTVEDFCLLGYNAGVDRCKTRDVSQEDVATIFRTEK
jgi:hypothetical protein